VAHWIGKKDMGERIQKSGVQKSGVQEFRRFRACLRIDIDLFENLLSKMQWKPWSVHRPECTV
jgi:hypothetical protein